jgi:hypothetical protein
LLAPGQKRVKGIGSREFLEQTKLVRPRLLLETMQNALAQQGKSCTAIHHALDKLYPGHLPFCLPVVVGVRSSHEDSSFVSFQTIGEALQLRDLAGRHCAEPSIKVFSFELANHQ